jgi:hypothetical protein
MAMEREKVVPVYIEEKIKSSYIDYSMNVERRRRGEVRSGRIHATYQVRSLDRFTSCRAHSVRGRMMSLPNHKSNRYKKDREINLW